MTISSSITTLSSILSAPAARRAIYAARFRKAVIRLRDRAPGPTPTLRKNSPSATHCLQRPRATSATSLFPSRPAICPRPIQIRWGFIWAHAPISGFFGGGGLGGFFFYKPTTPHHPPPLLI